MTKYLFELEERIRYNVTASGDTMDEALVRALESLNWKSSMDGHIEVIDYYTIAEEQVTNETRTIR